MHAKKTKNNRTKVFFYDAIMMHAYILYVKRFLKLKKKYKQPSVLLTNSN